MQVLRLRPTRRTSLRMTRSVFVADFRLRGLARLTKNRGEPAENRGPSFWENIGVVGPLGLPTNEDPFVGTTVARRGRGTEVEVRLVVSHSSCPGLLTKRMGLGKFKQMQECSEAKSSSVVG